MPSTVITAFDYDPAAAALTITFVSGRRDRSADVPAEVAAAMRAAFSKGSFFNRHIRDRYAHAVLAGGPPNRKDPRAGGVERGPTGVRHAGESRAAGRATGGKSRRATPRLHVNN